ncbi:hypothetical protein SSX86_008245 [Deinandra increscens subsp. villosa]|uniref:Uncharacterized protein n=1 Tax=Deinandra increscens subsp. villosa TaxID=3103831 RepID=A0AAP0DAX8_9ASTR
MPTTTRSDRKPPLAMRSPIRLRPRGRHVQSTLQSPSGTSTKSCLPKQSLVMEEHELRPEYQAMSCELNALTKMVQDILRGSTTTNQSANASPMFQRGKLYEEYSARRNERLKRKRGESVVEKKTPCKQYLGVRRIESAMRSTTEVKKFESVRKMATPLVERRQVAMTQKYSLRSSSCKENKKPPLAMSSMGATVERKTDRKGHYY